MDFEKWMDSAVNQYHETTDFCFDVTLLPILAIQLIFVILCHLYDSSKWKSCYLQLIYETDNDCVRLCMLSSSYVVILLGTYFLIQNKHFQNIDYDLHLLIFYKMAAPPLIRDDLPENEHSGVRGLCCLSYASYVRQPSYSG